MNHVPLSAMRSLRDPRPKRCQALAKAPNCLTLCGLWLPTIGSVCEGCTFSNQGSEISGHLANAEHKKTKKEKHLRLEVSEREDKTRLNTKKQAETIINEHARALSALGPSTQCLNLRKRYDQQEQLMRGFEPAIHLTR